MDDGGGCDCCCCNDADEDDDDDCDDGGCAGGCGGDGLGDGRVGNVNPITIFTWLNAISGATVADLATGNFFIASSLQME